MSPRTAGSGFKVSLQWDAACRTGGSFTHPSWNDSSSASVYPGIGGRGRFKFSLGMMDQKKKNILNNLLKKILLNNLLGGSLHLPRLRSAPKGIGLPEELQRLEDHTLWSGGQLSPSNSHQCTGAWKGSELVGNNLCLQDGRNGDRSPYTGWLCLF